MVDDAESNCRLVTKERPGQVEFDEDNRGPWFPPAEVVEEHRPQSHPRTGPKRVAIQPTPLKHPGALPESARWADKGRAKARGLQRNCLRTVRGNCLRTASHQNLG
ncbi:hypothetical protein MTO96_017701 [Rhipicephalus appendiculatus]